MSILEFIDGDIEKTTDKASLMWEVTHYKVPGGWIVYRDTVAISNEDDDIKSLSSTATFVSDLDHKWKIK